MSKYNVTDLFLLASEQEREFYDQKLYPLQDYILSLLQNKKDIYLTGGTALTRFYLSHRFSDDMDFFIKVQKQDTDEQINTVKRTDIYAKDLAGFISRKFEIKNEHYDDMYSRFFVKTGDIEIKIDFVREYNHIGEIILYKSKFYLNNIEDIGACKISAFEDRCEAKDIIDLFYIAKKIPLSGLFELADIKRVPIRYETLLTLNTQGITGKALLNSSVDSEQLTSTDFKMIPFYN